MTMLNEIIPAAWRKPIYAAFAIIGVALGAIASAYGPESIPDWHATTTNVYLYLGGALGFTAAANTLAARRITGDEPVVLEEDELTGIEDPAEDDTEEDVPDEDALTDAVDSEAGYDWAQDALEAALAADTDETPPPAGYEPRH